MIYSVLDRDNTTITISTFHEQNQLGKYNFDPPYQRKSVWSDEKQSYFIDSILRNFPIPPIFLNRIIDEETGVTTFDVIDGKQRLTAITRFIEGEICSANEYGAEEDTDELEGIYFKDLGTKKKLTGIKAKFWKYNLPIEFIDPTDEGLIEMVFDRLNRNGEPLKGQELRNAQFHNKAITNSVDTLCRHQYWESRLIVTDKARMEDKAFASECLLTITEGKILGSNQTVLDNLYTQHCEKDFSEDLALAISLSNALQALELDYEGWRITGVSHLYGLWGLVYMMHESGLNIADFSDKLKEFYSELRNKDFESPEKDEYKKSMTSRTKERFMRLRRIKALASACGNEELIIR
jgi:hypothetical protein